MAVQKTEGRGVLFMNEKRHEKAPDYKGDLVLDQDYGKGTTIKISGWRKNTPKNHLISLSIDNYKADKSQHWPRPANTTDDDVPFN